VKCDEPKEKKVQQEEQKVEDFTSPIALVLLFKFFWKETTKRKN